MKRRGMFCKLAVLLGVMLMAVSCSQETQVTKRADTLESVKTLTEEFFEGINDQERYELTVVSNGEVYSQITADGDRYRLHYADPEFNDQYLFIEDGVKYVLNEGDKEPLADEAFYDMNVDPLKKGFRMFTDSVLTEDGNVEKYEATLKTDEEDGLTCKELEIVLTVKSENGGTVTCIGKAEGDRITDMKLSASQSEDSYETERTYRYGEDVSVKLPPYEIVKPSDYRHVDSPYATLGEVIAEVGRDNFYNLVYNDEEIYTRVDTYQLCARMSGEVKEEFLKMDPYSGSRDEFLDFIKDLPISDCIDVSDQIIDDETLASYVGKKLKDLVADGFKEYDWNIEERGLHFWLRKGDLVYEADIEVPEGFESGSGSEYEQIMEAVVTDIRFSEIDYMALPLE